jgi:hypothetical protein
MITKTPTNFSIDAFFPFTDVSLAPTGTEGNVLGSFRAPTLIHSSPGRADRVGRPITHKEYIAQSGANDANASLLTTGLVDRIWPFKDQKGDASFDNIKLFSSEEMALRWVDGNATKEGVYNKDTTYKVTDLSSAPFTRIAIVSTDKYTKVLYHDMFIFYMARELRRAVEDMGAWRPQIAHVGLGHLEKADVDKKAQLIRPRTRWTAGSVAWRGNKYDAKGYVYIPTDYIPYSTLKRVAPYYNIFYQVGFEWFKSLTNVDIGLSPVSSDIQGSSDSVVWSMLQMYLHSMAGTTDNPSPPMSPIDEESVVQDFKPLFLSQFTSGYYHLDPHGNRYSEDALKSFWAHTMMFSAACAAAFSKVQGCVYPANLMFEGGPKPEQVVQKMAMNIRPDYNFNSGSSDLPFTLLPSSLSSGEILTRLPALFYMDGDDSKDKKYASMATEWYGPKDPIVIQNVLTEAYKGEVPETVIEEDFYYASPTISRDSMMMQTYYNYRHYNVAWLPRPNLIMDGVTDLGHFFSMMADTKPLSGPYLAQPLGHGFIKGGGASNVQVDTAGNKTPKGKDEVQIVDRFDRQLVGQSGAMTSVSHKDEVFKVYKTVGVDETPDMPNPTKV